MKLNHLDWISFLSFVFKYSEYTKLNNFSIPFSVEILGDQFKTFLTRVLSLDLESTPLGFVLSYIFLTLCPVIFSRIFTNLFIVTCLSLPIFIGSLNLLLNKRSVPLIQSSIYKKLLI